MKVAVVRFPGTNCDQDVWKAVESSGLTPVWWWHEDTPSPKDVSAVILPGGFSYGDYLRCGALASRSPVMKSVKEAAQMGLPVLGICNGFQILCEAGLLPGVLLRNESQKFVDRWVNLKLNLEGETAGFWAKALGQLSSKREWKLPVAHGEGRYFVESQDLAQMKKRGQVLLHYSKNPNGSLEDIAGVTDETGSVLGLMPHPERAMQDWMGSDDGVSFFKAFLKQVGDSEH